VSSLAVYKRNQHIHVRCWSSEQTNHQATIQSTANEAFLHTCQSLHNDLFSSNDCGVIFHRSEHSNNLTKTDPII